MEDEVYDLLVVGSHTGGLWRRRFTVVEDATAVVDCVANPADRPAAACRIEITSASPSASPGAGFTDRATLQANKFGAHLSMPAAAVSPIL